MTGTITNFADNLNNDSLSVETKTSEAPLTSWISEVIKELSDQGTNSTIDPLNKSQSSQSKSIPVERIYPHVFDENEDTGQAIVNIKIALSDAKLALESYSEADIANINTRLTLIATTMSNTHELTKFNESLGAVVSYIRRATLNTPTDEINLPSLNGLVHVLLTISKNPMIDLNEASELIDKLSDEGWKGDYGFAETLLAAFFDDLEIDTDASLQASIFDKVDN